MSARTSRWLLAGGMAVVGLGLVLHLAGGDGTEPAAPGQGVAAVTPTQHLAPAEPEAGRPASPTTPTDSDRTALAD